MVNILKRVDALRGVGRLQKAILNAREQIFRAGFMAPADKRPCVGIQGCLNLLQIENSCVRIVDRGLMFDEGMLAGTKNHGRIRI